MKLSELNTDRAMDVLVEMTPFLCNIAADKALTDELKRKISVSKNASQAEMITAGAAKIITLIPLIFKDHKADVLGILAVNANKNLEEIAAQPITETIGQIREIVQDKDLLDFFKSFSQ